MTQILVTGGSGFIGRNLIKALLKDGFKVINLSRKRSGLDVIELNVDLRDIQADHLKRFQIEAVIHTASKVGFSGRFDDFYSTNVIGTKNLLDACAKIGVNKLIYTSSPIVVFDGDHIFGGDETLPYAIEPKSHYAKTKIEAEKLVLGLKNMSIAVLRPHLVFGPDDTNLIKSIVDALRTGKLFRFTEQDFLSDFTFVEDCVQAHLLALKCLLNKNLSHRIFFISSGEPVGIWKFIEEIAFSLGLSLKTRVIPEKLLKVIGFFSEIKLALGISRLGLTRTLVEHLLRHHFFDIKRAKTVLNYDPSGEVLDKLKFSLRAWLK
ncbi:MAG: NAD-dependent epimerase/dehydratase family protein [Deltaproteobacteria bacterium]|nr:NAD-dependent epimerase/dehydratase family protein [Deltaproteobacteria bacterium]